MILYGIKFKNIFSYELNDCITCTECEHSDFYYHIFQRIIHLYHIPFFPVGRISELECAHCKAVTEHKEIFSKHVDLPQEAKELASDLNTLKKEPRTPWSCYIGLAITLALMTCFAGFQYMKGLEIQEYIDHPTENQLLVVKLTEEEFADFPYTVIYVTDINDEEIAIAWTDISYSHKKGASSEAKILNKEISQGDLHRFVDKVVISTQSLKDFEIVELINK